jgi:hypothetical protein
VAENLPRLLKCANVDDRSTDCTLICQLTCATITCKKSVYWFRIVFSISFELIAPLHREISMDSAGVAWYFVDCLGSLRSTIQRSSHDLAFNPPDRQVAYAWPELDLFHEVDVASYIISI